MLTQQDLESRLWAAANSLRGPVDPADFKSFVFPLLFFKWVSDTWDLDHAAATADYGENIPPEVEADYHRFSVPEGCHWADLQKVSTNVGVALQNILDRLTEANPATLAGIFGDVAWGNKERLPEPSLLNLIDAFDRLTLNRDEVPNDMLGAAYEYLLRQFADESGKKAGEFFTALSSVCSSASSAHRMETPSTTRRVVQAGCSWRPSTRYARAGVIHERCAYTARRSTSQLRLSPG